MRLSARNTGYAITAVPGTARPVRLRIGGLGFCMEPDEAVQLANDLADAVAEINTTERHNR